LDLNNPLQKKLGEKLKLRALSTCNLLCRKVAPVSQNSVRNFQLSVKVSQLPALPIFTCESYSSAY